MADSPWPTRSYISGIKWGHHKAMPTNDARGMWKANFTDFQSFPELKDK